MAIELFMRILGCVVGIMVFLEVFMYLFNFFVTCILIRPEIFCVSVLLTTLIAKRKWICSFPKLLLRTLFEDIVKVYHNFTGKGKDKKRKKSVPRQFVRTLRDSKQKDSKAKESSPKDSKPDSRVTSSNLIMRIDSLLEKQQSIKEKINRRLEYSNCTPEAPDLARTPFSYSHSSDWEVCNRSQLLAYSRKDTHFKFINSSSRNVGGFESPSIAETCRRESRDVSASKSSTYFQNYSLNMQSEAYGTASFLEEERTAFQPKHLQLTTEKLTMAYSSQQQELFYGKSKCTTPSFLDSTGQTYFLASGKVKEYISVTILKPILEEIDRINAKFATMNLEGCQIGVLSIFSLKLLSDNLPKEAFPSFNNLIPYLESTLNQEYLVHRLRELLQGSCMREYAYDKGGTFHGRLWTKNFISDADIIAHLFCSYMDYQLPHGICFFGKKLFTTKYFKKAVFQQDPPKEGYFLYQYKYDPPLYCVVVEGVPHYVHEGRNNLFSAIAMFLEYVKIKHGGVLENIKLGPSGLNMLWVLDR